MTYAVFLSYSNRDIIKTRQIVSTLEDHNIPCWAAYRDIEAYRDWAVSIAEAIENSRIQVVIFSEYSITSGQILMEVEMAAKQELFQIPFYLDDIQPSAEFTAHLDNGHRVDAFKLPLEEVLQHLVSSIQNVLNGT